MTSQLKARVDGIAARVTEHANKINSGYEYRSTKVTVKYHSPKTGEKTLVRDDTGEIHSTEEMSPSEMQEELPLGMAAAVKAAEPLPNPCPPGGHRDCSQPDRRSLTNHLREPLSQRGRLPPETKTKTDTTMEQIIEITGLTAVTINSTAAARLTGTGCSPPPPRSSKWTAMMPPPTQETY